MASAVPGGVTQARLTDCASSSRATYGVVEPVLVAWPESIMRDPTKASACPWAMAAMGKPYWLAASTASGVQGSLPPACRHTKTAVVGTMGCNADASRNSSNDALLTPY